MDLGAFEGRQLRRLQEQEKRKQMDLFIDYFMFIVWKYVLL